MEKSTTAQAEAFYQKFKSTAASIEEQIDSLANASNAQVQSRGEITEQCLTRITQLSHEVKDAMIFLPAYDQRNYAQRVKELSERLDNVRASIAPKAKFSFKGGKKGLGSRPVEERNEPQSVTVSNHTQMEPQRENSEMQDSALQAATVEAKRKEIVRLPIAQATQRQSCVILDIQHCLVLPAQTSSSLFSTMTVKRVSDSVLDLGSTNGPVHLTSLENCTILMACRQFRMHTCKNCRIYLWCTSRPIIEDCISIAFAPLPSSTITSELLAASENKWDQIDDFNWLRSEPSPNWAVLQSADRVVEAQLVQLRNTGKDDDVEQVLSKVNG